MNFSANDIRFIPVKDIEFKRPDNQNSKLCEKNSQSEEHEIININELKVSELGDLFIIKPAINLKYVRPTH